MEFEFCIPGLQVQEISVWDANALVHLDQIEFQQLRNVLEEFGRRSAAAQGLRAPITDIWRLRSSDQRLYLHTSLPTSNGCTVLGGLKVGKKKLFLHRANGSIVEVEPLCVLDFYVHESFQRQGVGRSLFEFMCSAELLGPEQLGYDRPSPKLLSFLRKHCHLCSFVPQTNNFVVFEEFFRNPPASCNSRGRNSASSRRGAMRISSSSSHGRQHLGDGSSDSKPCAPGSRPAGAAALLTTGRQNVHVVGSAAALLEDGSDLWVPSSVRPPTPALQQSVQLHPADVGAALISGSISGRDSLRASLGGPGCPAAGVPSGRQPGHTSPAPQNVLESGVVQYARGAGVRDLQMGPEALDKCTYKSFERALLAAAVNPAPAPVAVGTGSSPSSCRDSLDNFKLNSCAHGVVQACAGISNSMIGGAGVGPAAHSACKPGAAVAQPVGNPVAADKHFELTSPYGSLDPQPGFLLLPGSEHVSLKRQAQQQLELQRQQQVVPWQAAGAGPPGHLLAAPTSSYAVPTAGMMDILGQHYQQQHSGGEQGQRHQQQQGQVQHNQAPGILSWDGIPPAMQQRAQQQLPPGRVWAHMQQSQQQQQFIMAGSNGDRGGPISRRQQLGDLCSYSGTDSGFGGLGSRCASGGSAGNSLDHLNSVKAAAASHRAGSGAASCLRMI